MYKTWANIIGLIGRTPLLRLSNIEEYFGLKAELYAKLEMYSPTGSVKDRAAYFMVKDAFDRGLIGKGSTIIEPTSGNMGISLAMLSSVYGYNAEIIMPDSMSPERISLIKAYGGRVTLTPGDRGMGGAIKMAEEMCKENKNSCILSQFTNKESINAHYSTTGPEIYEAMGGKIDYFVSGVGTGGTIGGVGRFLKERNSNVKIVAVEPSESAVLSGMPSGSHRIQGIGAGFVPPLFDFKTVDRIITVRSDEAEEFSKLLVRREGMFAGLSSGASLFAAIRIAGEEANRGKRVVTLLADGGEKYLSVVR